VKRLVADECSVTFSTTSNNC